MNGRKAVISELSRKVFIGASGLRAGWSALIFVAIWLTLALSGGALVRLFIHAEDPHIESPGVGILKESVAVAALCIATWIMARVEKRSVFSYGIADRRALSRLASGVVMGFAGLSVLVSLLWWDHLLVFDGRSLSGIEAIEYASLWGVMWLATALLEEGLFRGYLQSTLTRGLNFWAAAVILSLLFGAVHGLNPGESPIGLCNGVVYALMCCLGLRLTGSLWLPIGIHIGWDWGESYFYGVSDSGIVAEGRLFITHPTGSDLWSGGTTGPEGSIYALPVILAVAACVWILWGRKRQPSI